MQLVKTYAGRMKCSHVSHSGILLFEVDEVGTDAKSKENADMWRNKIHKKCTDEGLCAETLKDTCYLIPPDKSPDAIKTLLEFETKKAKEEAKVNIHIYSINNSKLVRI